ncbi:hypothetical protein Cgig2_008396 [Carnegiea gigantea]|uniref:Uncharacterized protein n=1 Tax=Carnegiea gigantea TaxID=171969 RepID=A0A9Q1QJN0_9CARY|nr:hypothetical protein Cgig2_008396 [Carnegiea gigantea]
MEMCWTCSRQHGSTEQWKASLGRLALLLLGPLQNGPHMGAKARESMRVRRRDVLLQLGCARAPARQFKDFDYRWMEYPPKLKGVKHPNDQSLTTYTGHSVLRTLIRCHFSPEYSTGQKYIYTGSNDGAVYIYDVVTGALVSKLDHHETTVRDCSWHPSYPMIVSSSWDGTVVRSEIRGDDDVPPPPLRRRSRRRRHFL